jgi:FMN phosphatase YigB (HAD superfamily)
MNNSLEESKPRVFIGSSAEGLEIAKLIDQGLFYDADCFLWTDSRIFGASEHVMESLERALDECTYAIIVLSPDDMGESRGASYFMPRDNLLFEMGLFAGRHGRKSVFMVIPKEIPIKIPTDLQGINPCKYKTLKQADGPPSYHVNYACMQISEVLKKHRSPGRQARPVADSFWKSLADTVLIVYGVEHNAQANPKEHPRVSPRDLETAHLIFGFLNRYYPEKTVRLCPAREPKWEGDLTRESDLILIGGFVTNEMYKIYRSTYEREFEQNLRLKMGRLCRIEGRRVYHLGFEESAGYVPRSEPQELENISSEFVTRDYGMVTSRTAMFYENDRRIITIGGVKGNGTKAAAMALTKVSKQIPDLNTLLPAHFSGHDSFEMVVEAKVKHNTIASFSAVEVLLNDRRLDIATEGDVEVCELDTACAGCKFGLVEDPDAVSSNMYPHIPQLRGVKAIIFDLDDTLVDTSRYLIDQLEADAAEMMIKAGMTGTDKAEIHEILMQLRMAHPDNIEEMLVKRLPQTTTKAIRARRRVLAKASSMLEQLRMNPEVINLLERLAKTYKLYLVTAGDYAYQKQKIKHLDYEYHLRHYFAEDPVTGIVEAGSTESKEQKMLSLIKGNFSKDSVVVVGNRWDHEIRAAKKLGLRTICVRHGEGSSLVPDHNDADPHHLIINNIMELSHLL